MDLFSYPPGSFDYGRLSPHLENHSMEISDYSLFVWWWQLPITYGASVSYCLRWCIQNSQMLSDLSLDYIAISMFDCLENFASYLRYIRGLGLKLQNCLCCSASNRICNHHFQHWRLVIVYLMVHLEWLK